MKTKPVLFIALILFFIAMLPKINAMSCEYDSNPLLIEEIEWICTTIEDSKCYGLIFSHFSNQSDTSSLISVSPETQIVADMEYFDYFETQSTLVNIKFNIRDLFEGITYNFTVKCVSGQNLDTFSTLITPEYGILRETPHRFVWVKENTSYIIVAIIVIIIILGVLAMLKRFGQP